MGDLEGRLLSYVEVRKVGLVYGGLPSPEHLEWCVWAHVCMCLCVGEKIVTYLLTSLQWNPSNTSLTTFGTKFIGCIRQVVLLCR